MVYDLNGNRTKLNTTAYLYAANSNRLTKVGTKAQTLDPAGNTTTDNLGYTYTHDAAGRLKEARSGKTLKGTYTYNHRHQRTRKVAGSTTTVYHYDLEGRLIAETKNTGVLIRAYVHDDEAPIAQVTKGTTDTLAYLHPDQLGTPRLATDASRTTVWRYDGNAFGQTLPTGTLTVNLRFPGQYYDAETKLHYNWHRYYDPRLGRYLTSDPIGLDGGLNTYTYVENRPTVFTDPLGLKTLQCTKPLNALGPKYGPLGYKYGPLLYHQYSCVVDKNGKVTCGGQDRGEGGEGKPSNDVLDPPGGQCKQTQPDNDCFEQCLINEWAKPRPKYGIIPFGTDCQEYDDDVNTRCRKQCNIKK
jgi:RHS repeat-associated protein